MIAATWARILIYVAERQLRNISLQIIFVFAGQSRLNTFGTVTHPFVAILVLILIFVLHIPINLARINLLLDL